MSRIKDNRDKLVEDLFKLDTAATTTVDKGIIKESLKTKFVKLEKLKKMELSKWWDGATLKRYVENKRVPRGLRIMIFPTYDDLDIDLLSDWEENLHGAAYTMMDILIKNSERKVKKFKEEIDIIEKEIKETNLKDATEKNYEILNGIIEEFQLQLKDKKLGKIKRDERDYNSGRVFSFAKRFDALMKFS